MTKHLILFESTSQEKNENARQKLRRLKNTNIEFVTDCGLLEEFLELPFIETTEGTRKYGIASIEKYVLREEQKKAKRK